MTETSATSSNGQETAVNPRSAYLPVPPAGWEYAVVLMGPAGTIRVDPKNAPLGVTPSAPYQVHVSGPTADKSFDAPSLKAGVRAVVDAAKALTAIAEHEEKAAEAKAKLLDTIGPERVEVPEPPKDGKTHASRAELEEAGSTKER